MVHVIAVRLPTEPRLTQTGSRFVTAPIAKRCRDRRIEGVAPAVEGTFELLTGELKRYVKTAKTAIRACKRFVRTAARPSFRLRQKVLVASRYSCRLDQAARCARAKSPDLVPVGAVVDARPVPNGKNRHAIDDYCVAGRMLSVS